MKRSFRNFKRYNFFFLIYDHTSSDMEVPLCLMELGPLFIFSYIGVLLRVIISEFSSSRRAGAFALGSALNPVLGPNVLGCFIMGIIQHPSSKPAMIRMMGVHVHTGISTGFAGSLTSFSSWIGYTISLLFLYYPSPIPPVIEVLWCIVIGWSTSYLAFFLGFHSALAFNLLFFESSSEDLYNNEINDRKWNNVHKIGMFNGKNHNIFTFAKF